MHAFKPAHIIRWLFVNTIQPFRNPALAKRDIKYRGF